MYAKLKKGSQYKAYFSGIASTYDNKQTFMVAQDAHITFTYRQEMIWRYYVVWITYNFQLQSMKSKINENLYITGEMLDVNGDCGGYNLTFAFISGYLSGKDIK